MNEIEQVQELLKEIDDKQTYTIEKCNAIVHSFSDSVQKEIRQGLVKKFFAGKLKLSKGQDYERFVSNYFPKWKDNRFCSEVLPLIYEFSLPFRSAMLKYILLWRYDYQGFFKVDGRIYDVFSIEQDYDPPTDINGELYGIAIPIDFIITQRSSRSHKLPSKIKKFIQLYNQAIEKQQYQYVRGRHRAGWIAINLFDFLTNNLNLECYKDYDLPGEKPQRISGHELDKYRQPGCLF